MGDLEPITRNEKLWSGEDLTPVTRREMYIKHLYDETQVIPEYPVTREEMFILKAGEELHDVTIEQLTATENKTYSEEGVAYSPVIVNVPQTTLTTLDVTENGTYTAPSGTAYSEVDVDVPLPENAYLLKEIEDVEIASFNDGSDLPMPKLEVAIEPVQDLHGYDAPWVGGAGKNKLQVTATTQTINGVTFTVNSDGTVNLSGTATGTFVFPLISGTLSFSSDTIITGGYAEASASKVALRINGSNLVPSEGYTISANTNITEIAIRVNSGFNTNGVKLYPMIRLSTESDDTFAPYSNICPIIGWDEVNVGVVGKNLFDKTATDTNKGFISGKWINQTGNTFSYGDWSVSEYIRVDGEKIAVSGMTVAEQISSGRGGYCCYDKYKNVLGGGTYNALTQIITLPTNTEYIRISVWNQNKDVCQLELSETATAYEPYNGNTYTIDLDGTRYGGKVDLVSGVMTVDRVEKAMPANWSINAESSIYWLITHTTSDAISVENTDTSIRVISDGFKGVTADEILTQMTTTPNYVNCIAIISSKRLFLKVKKADYPTLNDLYSMIQTNNLRLVYELATPLTIQLSPTVVKSLRGKNNVWADTGDILDLSYLAKEE